MKNCHMVFGLVAGLLGATSAVTAQAPVANWTVPLLVWDRVAHQFWAEDYDTVLLRQLGNSVVVVSALALEGHDVRTGARQLGLRAAPSNEFTAAAATATAVYATNGTGTVTRVTAAAGTLQTSSHQLRGARDVRRLVANSGLLVTVDRQFTRVAAYPETGGPARWEFEAPPGGTASLQALADGTLLVDIGFLHGDPSQFFVLDGRSGAILRQPLGRMRVRAMDATSTVYHDCDDNVTWRSRNADGGFLWTRSNLHPWVCELGGQAFWLAGSTLYVAHEPGLLILDAATGRTVRTLRSAHPDHQPNGILAVEGDRVVTWVSGEDISGDSDGQPHWVMAFNLRDGGTTERMLLPAGPGVVAIRATSLGVVLVTYEGRLKHLAR